MNLKSQVTYKTPRLEIFPSRIVKNTKEILKQCAEKKVDVICVTKVTSAHPAVVQALLEGGAAMLADSRLENLKSIRLGGFSGPLMLLRLPTPSAAFETVQWADYSLFSSSYTASLLGKSAKIQGKVHKGILMVDVGDLREGVWENEAVNVARACLDIPGFELAGLGCNLACFGGVIPTSENVSVLLKLKETIERELHIKLQIITGGNSSGLPLLKSGSLPVGVNLYRIGETILLGCNVSDRTPWPGTVQNTFEMVAEIIELQKKPSCPIGDRGQDAFGGMEEFVDRGWRKRAILNIGRQDVAISDIRPLDESIEVLGGSSDHLILDVDACKKEYQVGDEVRFLVGYGALLALSTSNYVQKYVCQEK